jgi:DNA-binding HxlR family transcriptional regulator
MNSLGTKIEPKVGCVAATASIVGNKWTALILKDLVASPVRFCELEKSVEGINPRILTQRLEYLSLNNIVERTKDGYSLTDKGRDLIPVLKQMAAWGAKYSSH